MNKENMNPYMKHKRLNNNCSYAAQRKLKSRCVIWVLLLLMILFSSFIILGFAVIKINNVTLNMKSIESEIEYLHDQILQLQSSLATSNLLGDLLDFENDQMYEDNFHFKKSCLTNKIDLQLDDDYDLNYSEEDDDIGRVVDTNFDSDKFNPDEEDILRLLKTENFTDTGRETDRSRRSATTENIILGSEMNEDFKSDNDTSVNVILHDSVALSEDEDKIFNETIPILSLSASTTSKMKYIKDKPKNVRRKLKKPQLKSGTQWKPINGPDMIAEEDDSESHRRNKHRQRNNIETLDERTSRHRLSTAIHFNGDASKYVVGQHTNYNGNNHLRHLSQTYVDWIPTNWVKSLNMDQKFQMHEGILNIKENGLYLIYSQIYYLDEHDINGYRVYKNEESILQCTTMTHTVSRVIKSNTCFTAGVEYLIEGDQISIRDLAEGRYSLFERGKSFFGLVKLGDMKLK